MTSFNKTLTHKLVHRPDRVDIREGGTWGRVRGKDYKVYNTRIPWGGLCIWILGAVMFSLMYTYVKTYQIIYFKYVQFIECQRLFLT